MLRPFTRKQQVGGKRTERSARKAITRKSTKPFAQANSFNARCYNKNYSFKRRVLP